MHNLSPEQCKLLRAFGVGGQFFLPGRDNGLIAVFTASAGIIRIL